MNFCWHIVVPAWGNRHVKLFRDYALPAIRKAAKGISGQWTLTVHTDQEKFIGDVIRGPHDHPSGINARIVRVAPGPSRYIDLGNIHRQMIKETPQGHAIAFINADMVASIEAFAAAEARFREGKRLIMCASPRTNMDTFHPYPGARARDLLTWAWWHRHAWISDCIYGEGATKTPSNIFFRQGENVVLHAFHLHPFAMLNGGESFSGFTIDVDLPDRFPRSQVHVVDDPDELAFAEMSPAVNPFGSTEQKLDANSIAHWAQHNTTAAHRWMFGQQIVIKGERRATAQCEAHDILLRMYALGRNRKLTLRRIWCMLPLSLRYDWMVSMARLCGIR